MRASFFEIYNEKIHDLLNPDGQKLNLRLEGPNHFFVEGLSLRSCTTAGHVIKVFLEGMANRRQRTHCLNAHSSRSHAVLNLQISSPFADSGDGKYAKLCFVDLAGSERVKSTKVDGEMMREAQFINKSLVALAKITSSLSYKQVEHLPYRDSKLTMVLADCLAGKNRILMLACISPSIHSVDETGFNLAYVASTTKINENEPRMSVVRREWAVRLYRQPKEPRETDRRKTVVSCARSVGGSLTITEQSSCRTGSSRPSIEEIAELTNKYETLLEEQSKLKEKIRTIERALKQHGLPAWSRP